MQVNELAGRPAPPTMLVNVPRLVTAYYSNVPDPAVLEQRVAFGTSGHRGSAFDNSFNEWHVLAMPADRDVTGWIETLASGKELKEAP